MSQSDKVKRVEPDLSKDKLCEQLDELQQRLDELNGRASELEATNEALRESEECFRAVIDSSPAVIFLKDTEGRYLLANKQFEKRTGLASDEVMGKTFEETGLVDEVIASQYLKLEDEVLKSGQARVAELPTRQPDGTWGTALVNKFPVFDAAGAKGRYTLNRCEDSLMMLGSHKIGLANSYQPLLTLNHHLGRDRFYLRYLSRLMWGYGRSVVILDRLCGRDKNGDKRNSITFLLDAFRRFLPEALVHSTRYAICMGALRLGYYLELVRNSECAE